MEGTMARFFIQATHTPQECLQGLDEIVAQGPQALAGYDFGCAVGDHSNHVCQTTIEALDESAARMTIPSLIRDRAKIVEVGKFTPEQVRSFHAS
jgi:hypothetical protein